MPNNQNMDRVLSTRLRLLDDPGRLDLAFELVQQLGARFDLAACSLVVEELASVHRSILQPWLSMLPDTANGAWIQTQLLTDGALVAQSWERFFSFQPHRDPFDLLAWSRSLAATGLHDRALQKLSAALAQEVPYKFFARAEKLVHELAGKKFSSLRQCKIAVLGSSTTNLLVPLLRALCLRDRIEVEIYEAPFGSIPQEILDKSSGLSLFRPDILLLVMHWRDLRLEAITGDESGFVSHFIEEQKTMWSRLSDSFACHVVQPSFDYPATEAYGYLGGVLAGGRTRIIDLLNLKLREEVPAHVSILDLAAVQRRSGMKRWENEPEWVRYRQHPGTEALPELAEAYMSHVRAVLGLSHKVLVTDLDNTLWNGVIGEDGLDGIRIGPGSPEGESHLSLQHYLLDLRRRGILLAVCSKNNLEDAKLPFLHHPQMALRLDDFAAFKANWDDKSVNLLAIARDLSLGLDSFVFLDDNPIEREWVGSQLPQVTVVEPGTSPFQFLYQLDRGRYFEAVSLSREDLVRADQYRAETQRENIRAASSTLDDFLQNLQLQASVEAVSSKNLARVTQLVNKTNQFNLTTRRYTEAQIYGIAQDPQAWAGAFHMYDRMGGYGLIGVLFCKPSGQFDTWEIDAWLMSCRALGRQMEKFMFDRMVEAALLKGIRRIVGIYRPTAKNGLVKELYDQLGFRRISESEESVRYMFDSPTTLVITATHVRDVSSNIGAAER
jgi:FkbH-like protein